MVLRDSVQKSFPALPGCYIMKDDQNTIIYVGKAINIKKRVISYFAKDIQGKTALLMSKVVSIEYIITDNEVEALLLENTLIKQHQPKYNIDLKSSVRYAYIWVSDEEYPRIMTVRSRKKNGHLYGPYVDGYLRVQLIKLCIDLFKIRICKIMPKRPCLQLQIQKCDAPCINNISKKDYLANVDRAKNLLEGKTADLEASLESEMQSFAKSKEFERAAERRNQLFLLRSVLSQQKVETQRQYDQDVFATMLAEGVLHVVVFLIKKGVIAKREKYSITLIAQESFSDFLRVYYTTHVIPKEIIIDQDLSEKDLLEAYFSKLAAKQVAITNPKQGEKKQLLDMARQNSQVDLYDQYPELAELSRVLKLKTLPKRIECFDISHLGSQDVVAASVQYLDGKPNPSEYRRYDIRTVKGQDDFRSMYEAVFRRYHRLKQEQAELPDLVIIDGGKQQLLFARKALAAAGVNIPIMALAKKEEEIYLPYLSVPVRLPRNNSALKLLQRIRDSTHNFVVGFQRIKRGKRMLK